MEIESHPFFEKISSDQRQELIRHAIIEEYTPDTIIFEEESRSDGMYLVLEGTVAFSKKTPENTFRTVSYSTMGDFFGEIGLFTGETRSSQVESRGNVILAKIPREYLLSFFKSTKGPIENILQSIISHLHDTTQHYIDDLVAQEKLAVVGNMINTIIHDFKNPFCLISLGAQLIMQSHADEKTQKLCNNIEEQVQRMVDMAEELAQFSRGQHELKPEKVNVYKLLERFKALNFPFFQDDLIKIEIDVPDIVIEGEENKLLRVIQNLVGNAIDAFEENPGEISITGKVEGEELKLEIKDNGSGIPETIREHFFEPFITYGKSRGTGLGSAIAKSIVEAHNGKIRFETKTGKGTTFYISLPIKQQAVANVA